MNWQFLLRQMLGLLVTLLLLVGCAASPQLTPEPTPQSTPASGPTNAPTPAGLPVTATPDPCDGWSCTLSGVVYVGAPSPGNELAGTPVELSHVSYCSPTRGQHNTTTGPDGGFGFEVFLHDTDTFWIQVEQDGYEPARQSLGGFDCLYCACPPVEIVLQSLGTSTAAP